MSSAYEEEDYTREDVKLIVESQGEGMVITEMSMTFEEGFMLIDALLENLSKTSGIYRDDICDDLKYEKEEEV